MVTELCLTKGWTSKLNGRYEKWASRATCKKHLENRNWDSEVIQVTEAPLHCHTGSMVVTEADTIFSGPS